METKSRHNSTLKKLIKAYKHLGQSTVQNGFFLSFFAPHLLASTLRFQKGGGQSCIRGFFGNWGRKKKSATLFKKKQQFLKNQIVPAINFKGMCI